MKKLFLIMMQKKSVLIQVINCSHMKKDSNISFVLDAIRNVYKSSDYHVDAIYKIQIDAIINI